MNHSALIVSLSRSKWAITRWLCSRLAPLTSYPCRTCPSSLDTTAAPVRPAATAIITHRLCFPSLQLSKPCRMIYWWTKKYPSLSISKIRRKQTLLPPPRRRHPSPALLPRSPRARRTGAAKQLQRYTAAETSGRWSRRSCPGWASSTRLRRAAAPCPRPCPRSGALGPREPQTPWTIVFSREYPL